MLTLLIVLLLLMLIFGATPYNTYGSWGWSPAAVLLLVIVVLLVAGVV
jgi:hypothetical protein